MVYIIKENYPDEYISHINWICDRCSFYCDPIPKFSNNGQFFRSDCTYILNNGQFS